MSERGTSASRRRTDEDAERASQQEEARESEVEVTDIGFMGTVQEPTEEELPDVSHVVLEKEGFIGTVPDNVEPEYNIVISEAGKWPI